MLKAWLAKFDHSALVLPACHARLLGSHRLSQAPDPSAVYAVWCCGVQGAMELLSSVFQEAEALAWVERRPASAFMLMLLMLAALNLPGRRFHAHGGFRAAQRWQAWQPPHQPTPSFLLNPFWLCATKLPQASTAMQHRWTGWLAPRRRRISA